MTPARRLTPADQDADRPAWSPDGSRIAYVRAAATGETIWEIEVASGSARVRVGADDLRRVGLIAPRYALHDLAWSPSGGTLAFSWYDGRGWGEIALSDPDGRLTPLHVPVMDDPWEEGAVFNLSASTFLWDANGSSGTFIGWDDDCGSLYRAGIPDPGAWAGAPVRAGDRQAAPEAAGMSKHHDEAEEPPAVPRRLPLPPGCRSSLAGTPGYWLYTDLDDDLSPRVTIVNDAGEEIDALEFPLGAPPRARWGSAAVDAGGTTGVRPPVAGWWYDADQHERVLFVWEKGSLLEWRREPSAGADAIAVIGGALLFLEGPPGAAHLALLNAPGAAPREIDGAPVADFTLDPSGRRVVTVRSDGDRRSLWVVDLAAP